MDHLQIPLAVILKIPVLFIPPLFIEIGAIVSLLGAMFIIYWMRINAVRNQKADLEQQIQIKTQLLAHAADNLRRAKEETAMCNRTKKSLLSRINHEIRTPMNGVIGMVSLLSQTQLTSEQQDYSETIRVSGEKLLSAINDILLGDVLAHAKVESDRQGLEQKEFDLRNCIEEVFEIFANHSARADLELVYQMDSSVPDRIIGDSVRLRQIIINLIENAMKFTEKGEIFVKVSAQQLNAVLPGENKFQIIFEIQDTGKGIAADRLKALTGELLASGQTEPQHLGKGLAICKRLVKMMGGGIEIASQQGKGSTVKFNIRAEAGSTMKYNSSERTGQEGKHILVIEDNQTLQDVLNKELTQWNFKTTTTSSGVEALQVLSGKTDFDLVLVEMQMPEMNGMEVSQRIKEAFPSLPIILLNATGDESDKQQSDLFSSVVRKPIKLDVLRRHILSALIHQDKATTPDQEAVQFKLSEDFAKQYPLHILVAEDDPINQKLAKRVLTKLGYKPDVANHGKEVLEVVDKGNYDLILMDIQMPEMNGLEATRMIRLCLSVQPVIIAMTANAMQGDREECLQAGMDDYISKPVNIGELVILLEKWAMQVKHKL